jgi:hypothetical protein
MTTSMTTVLSPPLYSPDDKKSVTEESVSPLASDQVVARPEIDYSSVDAFFSSSWRRFVSLWTRRFILSLLAGQVVSLCITCTNVTTEELTTRNWDLPTTQTFFLYISPTRLTSPSDGSVRVQILLHFLDLYTLHDLPVYAPHSVYNSGTGFSR